MFPKRAPLPKAKRELLVSVDIGEQRVAVLEDGKVAEVYLEVWRRAVELGIGEHAHFGDVHALELHLGRGPDAALRERVLDLEEAEDDREHHDPDGCRTGNLGDELSATAMAVEDAIDAGLVSQARTRDESPRATRVLP